VGLIIQCILTAVYPGKFFSAAQNGLIDEELYLVRWPSVTLIRFDDEDLMKGEEIINGAPLLIRKAPREWMDLLVSGPLPAQA
jgi:hypothetical protein